MEYAPPFHIFAGFSQDDIRGYREQSGDHNPIHWDPTFFRFHPEYRKFDIGEIIVPGLKVLEAVYKEGVLPWCRYQMDEELCMKFLECSFYQPLLPARPWLCRWERINRDKNGMALNCLAYENDGSRVPKKSFLHCGIEVCRRDTAPPDEFSLFYAMAGIVWRDILRTRNGHGILMKVVAEFLPDFSGCDTAEISLREIGERKDGKGSFLKIGLDAIPSGSRSIAARASALCLCPLPTEK
jgi:hypothetical protein